MSDVSHQVHGAGDGDRPVAIVTGAMSGLGAATASLLAESGYLVAAFDLHVPDQSRGSRDHEPITRYEVDVRDRLCVEKSVGAVIDSFGRVDVVVNCAGVDHTHWLEELTVEQFDHVIGVNLRGPFLMAKVAWPQMRQQGHGHIVNIASTAAIRAWSGASAYHASKFGLLGLSRGLSVEGRRDGINVTTVIPGGMQTRFFERFLDQGIPLPDEATLQDPASVAQTILFAISAPPGSVVQEIIVTPTNETSWP
jgi:NAD(P)-dependent dehydrogenase (short-subunit alcohol dehydrogenase family)